MSTEHQVRPIGQHNSKVCWIACYRMLYSWKKVSDQTCYDRLVASKIPMDRALNIGNWPKTRNAMKLTSHRVGYLKEFENLQYTINTFGPMWCAGDFSSGSGHVILVTGIFPKNKTIRIIDPWEVHKGTNSEVREFSWWKSNIKDSHAACQTWY